MSSARASEMQAVKVQRGDLQRDLEHHADLCRKDVDDIKGALEGLKTRIGDSRELRESSEGQMERCCCGWRWRCERARFVVTGIVDIAFSCTRRRSDRRVVMSTVCCCVLACSRGRW